jgi:hypothetical protein
MNLFVSVWTTKYVFTRKVAALGIFEAAPFSYTVKGCD